MRVFRDDVLGESRLDFARRVGCSVRSVERWEAGGVIGRQLSRALHDALCKAPEQAQAEFGVLRSEPDTVEAVSDDKSGEAAEAGGSTDRREVLELVGASAAAPTAASDALVVAAAEVMEFTRRAGTSAVGSGMLEQLELVVIDLNRAYLHEPPGQLFGVVRWYRRRVGVLIERRHTLRQGRDLYVYAGWLSELLARLARDLGALTLAESYCVDAWQHGWQAEDDELCAWAMWAKAGIAVFNNRPDAALSAALEGMGHAPTGHPIAVRLVGQAARAHGRLAQREDFKLALREAMDLHDHLPARASARFGQDTYADLASPLPDSLEGYAASSCVWLGLAKEGQQYAERTLRLIGAVPAERRSPSMEAIARIDLGLARTALGFPDEACALGVQALSWEPPAGHPVRARALDLDGLLQRRYPDLPEVAAFHERCHLLTRAQLPPDRAG